MQFAVHLEILQILDRLKMQCPILAYHLVQEDTCKILIIVLLVCQSQFTQTKQKNRKNKNNKLPLITKKIQSQANDYIQWTFKLFTPIASQTPSNKPSLCIKNHFLNAFQYKTNKLQSQASN